MIFDCCVTIILVYLMLIKKDNGYLLMILKSPILSSEAVTIKK